MSLITMCILTLCVSVDILVLSVALGLRGCSKSHRTFCVVVWTACAASMLLLGWRAADLLIAQVVDRYAWIAGVGLTWVGLQLIYGDNSPSADATEPEPTKTSVVVTGLAASLDVAVLGASAALKQQSLISTALVVVSVTACTAMLGIAVADRYRLALGRFAEVAGGCVLVGTGGYYVCF